MSEAQSSNRASWPSEVEVVAEHHTSSSSQMVGQRGTELFLIRLHGAVDGDPGTTRCQEALERLVGQGTAPQVFFDLRGFVRYETRVRAGYTAALRPHLGRLQSIWVVADSKVVRMGATVARLVLPVLEVVDPGDFDDKLEAAIRDAT